MLLNVDVLIWINFDGKDVIVLFFMNVFIVICKRFLGKLILWILLFLNVFFFIWMMFFFMINVLIGKKFCLKKGMDGLLINV